MDQIGQGNPGLQGVPRCLGAPVTLEDLEDLDLVDRQLLETLWVQLDRGPLWDQEVQ